MVAILLDVFFMIIKSINAFKQSKFRNKKVLAIDFGAKKMGFAYSDAGQVIANPLKVYYRKGLDEDLIAINNIILSLDTSIVLLGLPLNQSGKDQKSSRQVKSFANILNKNFNIDVFFWDERFSTKQAADILKLSGADGEAVNKKDDMIAASLILEGFLEYFRKQRS